MAHVHTRLWAHETTTLWVLWIDVLLGTPQVELVLCSVCNGGTLSTLIATTYSVCVASHHLSSTLVDTLIAMQGSCYRFLQSAHTCTIQCECISRRFWFMHMACFYGRLYRYSSAAEQRRFMATRNECLLHAISYCWQGKLAYPGPEEAK